MVSICENAICSVYKCRFYKTHSSKYLSFTGWESLRNTQENSSIAWKVRCYIIWPQFVFTFIIFYLAIFSSIYLNRTALIFSAVMMVIIDTEKISRTKLLHSCSMMHTFEGLKCPSANLKLLLKILLLREGRNSLATQSPSFTLESLTLLS